MGLRSLIVGQFKQPHGVLGRLAGAIMATRESNRKRNEWTISLLELESDSKVLEIGCGPGLALAECSKVIKSGLIVGLDHSEIMVNQAQSRLENEISSNLVKVTMGHLSDIVAYNGLYDRVYSVNVIQFMPDMLDSFRKINLCLASNGLVATTYQPRSKRPTRCDALKMADNIESAMKAAGFAELKRHELPLEPVPVVCVIGRKRSPI